MSVNGIVIQKIGYGIYFNQDLQSYFVIPSLELKKLTICTLINIPTQKYKLIGCFPVVNGNELTNNWNLIPYQLRFCDSQLFNFTISNGKTIQGITFGTWNFNNWYFVTAVANGNKLSGYINGKKINETEQTISPNISTNQLAAIGRADTRYSTMLVSLVLIYKHALSDSEIKNILYNYPNIPKKNLVLWLDARTYDESAGKWYDLSGNGNHAIAYGSPKKVRIKEAEVIVS